MTSEDVSRCRTLGSKSSLASFISHPFVFCLWWSRIEGAQYKGEWQQPVQCTLPEHEHFTKILAGFMMVLFWWCYICCWSQEMELHFAHKMQVGPSLFSCQYWVLAICIHGAKSLSDTPVTPASLRILAPAHGSWKDSELSAVLIACMNWVCTESRLSWAQLISHWHTHAI